MSPVALAHMKRPPDVVTISERDGRTRFADWVLLEEESGRKRIVRLSTFHVPRPHFLYRSTLHRLAALPARGAGLPTETYGFFDPRLTIAQVSDAKRYSVGQAQIASRDAVEVILRAALRRDDPLRAQIADLFDPATNPPPS